MTTWDIKSGTLYHVTTTKTSLEFPSNITTIADGTQTESPFSSCRSIVKEIKFAQGSPITYIGQFCFANTITLTKADLSNCKALQQLSVGLFFNSSVSEVLLPEDGKITSFAAGSFARSKIKELIVPNSFKQHLIQMMKVTH